MAKAKSKLERKPAYILSLNINLPQTPSSVVHEQWISFSKSKIEDKAREVEADILCEMKEYNDFDFDWEEYMADGSKLKIEDFEDEIDDYEYQGLDLGCLPYVSIKKVIITNKTKKV